MATDPDPDDAAPDDAAPDDPAADDADTERELPRGGGAAEPVLVGGEPLPTEGPGSLAPILPRALARLTDFVLSFLVPFTLLIGLVGETVTDAEGTESVTYPGWVPLATMALLAVYEIGLVTWRGQTVGMMIGGLVVIRESDGLPPTERDAVRRAALPVILLGLGFYTVLLRIAYLGVYLSPILDQRTRKGWHERMAGTLVVRRR